jgi:glycerophosphoryl diester phosphodiesterase
MGRRRERLAITLGLLLATVAGATLLLVVQPEVARARVQILAHRGSSAYAPENTLAAFRLAVEQRADWLELDVQQTRDGQLVAFHDLRVERTTDGRGALRDLTLADLRTLDAGKWFGPEFAGERVPTFDEVLSLAREAGIRLFPEVKDPRFYPGIEERLAAALRAHEYEERAIVQSFDPA